ncbi:MAG: Maf family protein [Cocleimonas sp.]
MTSLNNKYPEIILASASPRRAELLDQIGVKYTIQPVDIDESSQANETPESLVKRLAIEKSQAVHVDYDANEKGLAVLGSDTLGVLSSGLVNLELLVKPRDFEHAHHMLSNMSGNWHEILSAVALSYKGKTEIRLNRNRVLFRELSLKEIEEYWETGEPQDKAGAYAVQGLAAAFIERIEGSYSGIMGLPLFETADLLKNINNK